MMSNRRAEHASSGKLADAGRADLVRALVYGGNRALRETAEILGYQPRPLQREESKLSVLISSVDALLSNDASALQSTVSPTEVIPPPRAFRPVPFWRPVASSREDVSRSQDVPNAVQRVLTEADLETQPILAEQAPPPIVARPRVWRALDDALRTPWPRREVDVARLVEQWARGRCPSRLPRRHGLGHARVSLVVDRSQRLQAFWRDQAMLYSQLAHRLGSAALRLVAPPTGERQPLPRIGEDEVLLAITDLGLYGDFAMRRLWLGWAERLRRIGARRIALVLCPSSRWEGKLGKLWRAIDWSAPGRAGAAGRRSGDAAKDHLLELCSMAVRVEPGLLRALRLLVPQADLATEADVWLDSRVQVKSSTALMLDPLASRELRRGFAGRPLLEQEQVAAALLRHHRHLPPEIRAEEVANLLAAGITKEVLGEAVSEAIEMIETVAASFEGSSRSQPWLHQVDAWLARFEARLSARAWSHGSLTKPLARAFKALHQRYPSLPLPAGLTPEMLAGFDAEHPARRFALWHEADKLRLRPVGETGRGSPLAEIWVRERVTLADGIAPARELGLNGDAPAIEWPKDAEALELVSDVESVRLEPWFLPEWASAGGRDEHGLWAAFEVKGVAQRMRWIVPGRFWMGSPESEEGRWDDEGPRHEVVLTEGFWLAETPCTQALWEAVMGSNPSRFKGVGRPVENVSWEDCQRFFEKLDRGCQQPGFRLPTEAQWEHACRAGTETATWVGDLANLSEIAWYNENSHETTHSVGLKPANPWGLYDMLGNVFEWCWDWRGDYSAEVEADPKGLSKGSVRVVRGGSWSTFARLVRAASRLWLPPAARDGGLGCRLSRGPERSE